MKSIAIVTGATGGLGSEFVRLLADKDIDEIWAVARDTEKLEALRARFGEKVMTLSLDLAHDEAYRAIKDMLEREDPLVRYLVNNAGGGKMDPSTAFSDEYIENGIATHCTAVAVLCNACIPYMQTGCRIINMSSQSAFQPVPYINLYGAGKAFVRNYSRALNVELKRTGITVTAVCPGWVKTELLEKERNGHAVKFPGMAQADAVARKALRDADAGRDMSVYGAYVKYMHLLAKVFPQRAVMRTWVNSVGKYVR